LIMKKYGKGGMSFKDFCQFVSSGSKHENLIDYEAVSSETELSVLQALKWAFDWFDNDGNNRIDTEELGVILRAMGQDPSEEDVKQILNEADLDNNNYLSFDEFQAALLPYILDEMKDGRMTEPELRSCFNSMDLNGDGHISNWEFTNIFTTQLELLSLEEANVLLRWADRDGDGTVGWEEFIHIFKLMNQLESDEVLEKSIDPKVRAALIKLSHGTRPDPQEHLLAFMGMPSAYRPSVLAPIDRMGGHTLADPCRPLGLHN